ncbi:response regulator [Candidatus Magnetomonas plexicatena]|uniref:response regulator n=1 Tax=Candidatus Magnetomonas plexicatena TaxID=2552947 RepID=UPI001C75643A|nr:response regulator [Nitrospirales bacterium LBB_01]
MARILIVDDSVSISRMLQRRLKKSGHEVYTAENGKIGVEMALSFNPDLTLMDMHMPVLNGYEATAYLRNQGYEGKIYALTASAMAHEANKSIESGCDGFLSKPVLEDFEKTLISILEKKRG